MNDVGCVVQFFDCDTILPTPFQASSNFQCGNGSKRPRSSEQLAHDRVLRNGLDQLLEASQFDHEATRSTVRHAALLHLAGVASRWLANGYLMHFRKTSGASPPLCANPTFPDCPTY